MQSRIRAGQTGKPLIRNIRLVVAFDGTAYQGWQVQPHGQTIQGTLRDAILRITREPVKLHGSGRTDAGVHARGMVANFRTACGIPARSLAQALNGVLPRDIRILSARDARQDFHARTSARSKIYRYQIYRGRVLLPHLAREHCHYPYPLDIGVMQEACRFFAGEHDFASFAKHAGRRPDRTSSSGTDTVRRILRCELKCRGLRLTLTVEGSGFLHHMVRNMVGTLLELGRGRMTPAQFRGLFLRRDRTLAGFTAPAQGLVLLRVRY